MILHKVVIKSFFKITIIRLVVNSSLTTDLTKLKLLVIEYRVPLASMFMVII